MKDRFFLKKCKFIYLHNLWKFALLSSYSMLATGIKYMLYNTKIRTGLYFVP